MSITIFVARRGSGFCGSEDARRRRARSVSSASSPASTRARSRRAARHRAGSTGRSSGPRRSKTSSARPASGPWVPVGGRREDLRVLDVDPVRREDAGDRREEAGPVGRADRHLGVAELPVVLHGGDEGTTVAAGEQREVAGRLGGRDVQEIAGRHRGDEAGVIRGPRTRPLAQRGEREVPAGRLRAPGLGPGEVAPGEHLARLLEELAQEAGLPLRPRARPHGRHVGVRQRVELLEPVEGADLLRERVDEVRVGEVAALGDGAHAQVLRHEPLDVGRLRGIEPHPHARLGRDLRPARGVVLARALADVVEERAEVERERPLQRAW